MSARGFGLPQLVVVLAILVTIGGIGLSAKAYIENERETAFAAGHKAAMLQVAQRDNQQLVAAAAQIRTLEEAARTREAENAKHMAALDARHAKEKANAQKQRDRDVAAARDGSLVLRFAADRPADRGGACGGDGGAGPPSAGAGERDGAATTELPRAIAADLLSLAADADEVVMQLTACQHIVAEDRR